MASHCLKTSEQGLSIVSWSICLLAFLVPALLIYFLRPCAPYLLFYQESWYLFFSLLGMLIFPYFLSSYTFFRVLLKYHFILTFLPEFEKLHKIVNRQVNPSSEVSFTKYQQISHIVYGEISLYSLKSSSAIRETVLHTFAF